MDWCGCLLSTCADASLLALRRQWASSQVTNKRNPLLKGNTTPKVEGMAHGGQWAGCFCY